MGPIIGMSPDKKAESPGSQGVCGAGTLPEAESASSPMATSLDRIGPAGVPGVSRAEPEDDELTNLNWLHENLLQNFTAVLVHRTATVCPRPPLLLFHQEVQAVKGIPSNQSPLFPSHFSFTWQLSSLLANLFL